MFGRPAALKNSCRSYQGAVGFIAGVVAALSTRQPTKGLCTTVKAGTCRLVVVRHGETDWNRELRVQGSTDIPLNGKGRAQAECCAKALASRFAGQQVSTEILSSELDRASGTAAAIATALAAVAGAAGVAAVTRVRNDARLNEWDLGVLEGMNKEVAKVQHGDDWAIFSQWCSSYVKSEVALRPVSGGESMEQVRVRAIECLEEACVQSLDPHRPVIVVTHGGVLGQLLRHAEQRGGEAGATYPSPNASISTFMVEPGGKWQLESWADTAHLSGDAAPIMPDYNEEECPVEDQG